MEEDLVKSFQRMISASSVEEGVTGLESAGKVDMAVAIGTTASQKVSHPEVITEVEEDIEHQDEEGDIHHIVIPRPHQEAEVDTIREAIQAKAGLSLATTDAEGKEVTLKTGNKNLRIGLDLSM